MKTNNHEVIFAIVNAGFAEDVMEVAKEQGARGGTILNARGVAKEDAAAFFGITIHSEKEILMMVVEKDIRDNVLNAIYKRNESTKNHLGLSKISWVGVKGNYQQKEEFTEHVGNSYMAGDRKYDIIATYSRTAGHCAIEGYLYDIE